MSKFHTNPTHWLGTGMVLLVLGGCSLVEALGPASTPALPPFADFSVTPERPLAGLPIEFVALLPKSTAEWSVPVAARWDFGDQAQDEGFQASHRFDAAGQYTVRLTTRSDANDVSIMQKTVVVADVEPGLDPPPPAQPPGHITFGAGVLRVGVDIESGTYRSPSMNDRCAWKRLRGTGGEMDDIIAMALVDGPAVVTILPGDHAFESTGCDTWTSDLSPITASVDAPFSQGTYIVGVDVGAGIWATETECFWKRMSDFTGSDNDILEINISSIVALGPDDRGFTSRCGPWERIQ